MLLVLASACAKPTDLDGRTCMLAPSWASPAYECTTGSPVVASAEPTPDESEGESESEKEPEKESEIEMEGDKPPEKEKKPKKEKDVEKEVEKEPEPEPEKDVEKEKDDDKDDDKEDEKDEEPAADSKASIAGDRIKLRKKVIFKKGTDEIADKSHAVLDDVVTLLKEHPEITKIEIQGHTDNRGTDEKNLKKSKERAKAVRDYLVDNGIKSKRIVTKGFGADEPVANNKTKAGRSKNRRIEIHILKRK